MNLLYQDLNNEEKMISFWIILTGALVAVSAGLLGCFLVLRRMSMVGDAISHAVLPGIVIAFLISGNREPLTILIGASILGLLTTFIIEYLHKKAKVQGDAAIGVTYTFLFAVGVILLSLFAGQVDIDQDCVLYGEIAYVPIDTWITASGINLGPRPIYLLGGLLIVIVLFIIFFYKQLSLTAFDPGFASAIGISTVLWHYLLMGLVSITTVVSFESVGAILIINFLIGPPAIAYLITKSLKRMLIYTVIIGILIAFFGYQIAAYLDVSVAGCMAVTTGIIFGFCFIYTRYNSKMKKKYIELSGIPQAVKTV